MKTGSRFFTVPFLVITLFGIIGCTSSPNTAQTGEGTSSPNELGTLQGDLLSGGESVPSEPADPVDGTNDVGVNDYIFGSKYGGGTTYFTN